MEHIPSHAIPMDAKDSIIVESFNSFASPAVDVFVRFLDSEGRTHRGGFRHTPNTDRTSATSRFRIGKGHLISVAFEPVGFTPRRGQTFLRAFLTRDDVGVVQPDFPLISDYLVDGALLAWPGSPLRSSVEGPGHVRSFSGTDPAAGSEISETVPAGARWAIRGGTFVLVTDGTAGNRTVNIEVGDGTNILERFGVSAVQAPGSTVRYVIVPTGYLASQRFSTEIILPREVVLFSGFTFSTTSSNLAVGDDFSAAQLLVEEWLEP